MRLPQDLRMVGLFLLLGAALGMWFVPLGGVLEAHGQGGLRPYAFAASASAAFVGPLLFGAMADRKVSPVILLRWLSVASAAASLAVSLALSHSAGRWALLSLIQLNALCLSPAWSLASTIIFAGLRDSTRDFGPVRAMATLGWVLGCWIVSVCHADRSIWAMVISAATWLGVTAVTCWLPVDNPNVTSPHLTMAQRLGLDALGLLRVRDHRVVLLTATAMNIPLAAFYPYTPSHLNDLGLTRTSAWMTVGQFTELLAMFTLAGMLARWRVKWVIAFGLGFGVLRFALCALDGRWWILSGIALHGLSYTLVFITAQIYLNQRVEVEWRGRAQALLTLLTSGVGNGIGYLSTGWWLAANTAPGGVRWSRFWAGLAFAVALLLIGFLLTYRGRQAKAK